MIFFAPHLMQHPSFPAPAIPLNYHQVTRLQSMVPDENGKIAAATDEVEIARVKDVEQQLETSKKLMKDLESTWEEKLARAEEVR